MRSTNICFCKSSCLNAKKPQRVFFRTMIRTSLENFTFDVLSGTSEVLMHSGRLYAVKMKVINGLHDFFRKQR